MSSKKPMSMRSAGLWLLLFAVACWTIVAMEAVLAHEADLVSIATALAFTATLVAWPFLGGLRLSPAKGVRHIVPCRQCGSGLVAGIPFCIHCGAFPKPVGYAV